MDDDYDFFRMARDRDSIHSYMRRCMFPLVGSFVNHEGWNPNDWGGGGKLLVFTMDRRMNEES